MRIDIRRRYLAVTLAATVLWLCSATIGFAQTVEPLKAPDGVVVDQKPVVSQHKIVKSSSKSPGRDGLNGYGEAWSALHRATTFFVEGAMGNSQTRVYSSNNRPAVFADLFRNGGWVDGGNRGCNSGDPNTTKSWTSQFEVGGATFREDGTHSVLNSSCSVELGFDYTSVQAYI